SVCNVLELLTNEDCAQGHTTTIALYIESICILENPQNTCRDAISPGLMTFNCSTTKCSVVVMGERLHLGRLRTLHRELHLGLLGMLLDCEELEKVRKCNMLKAVLNACASVVALEEASCVHHQIIECGWDSDVYVVNSLVDMYAKCESMEDAWRVFNKMPSQNIVTWTAVIVGHVKCREGQKALELFQQMQHEQIIQSGFKSDVFVGGSLVDMCANCRSMEDDWSVFKKQMCENGLQPNDITFICLLSACSHAGLVDEGICCYASVVTDYMISAKLEHHTCIVDLLDHAGQEAENMDQDHPQMTEFYAELQKLSGLMPDAGYMPCTRFILHVVEEQQKLFHLCHYSEKLAIAFGLFNTAPDCHTSTKFISKIVWRAIMVRDTNHFHHFEDCVCSCMDYW
ncbi:hypothetical protein BDL97_18G001500, partial [Sphagnum fallax]